MRWVALLRGINLGPNKRVAMADLRALLESLGYDDVRTYLQSGNAVFGTKRGEARKLERQIELQIEAELGFDVKVLVLTAEQLAAAVDGNPFAGRAADPKLLHFAFLSERPATEKLASLRRDEYAPDQFALGDRVLYLYRPNGFKASRLPNWERLLGVSVTERNWNTVTRLRDLAS